ncbi:hypothetical protein [Phormidesmis priestleyi]
MLAIDADYNMNLLSNLGLDYSNQMPTLHHSHDRFRRSVGLSPRESWSTLNDKTLPTFSVNPEDEYTASLNVQVTEFIKAIVVGLGDEDVLDSPLCGHGQVAPLKWYLSALETNPTTVIIDSVAGTDMINYNLYQGCDCLVGIVENHKNSLRVLKQIKQTSDRLNKPLYIVLNQSTESADEILSEYRSQVLGELPQDAGIGNYHYQEVGEQTKECVGKIWRSLLSNHQLRSTVLTASQTIC